MNPDYLWDPSRPADAEVQRLEQLLERYRYVEHGRPAWERPRRRYAPWIALAAAALAAAAVIVFLLNGHERQPGYRVHGIEGRELVHAGEAIETPAGASARLDIGALGRVELAGGTRLQVQDCGRERHSLYLERGHVSAMILAQPRLFQIDTPAGKTIDLGCAYELDVDAAGAALVRVTLGQIEFTLNGREVLVPAHASCRALPGTGPDWPLFDSSSAALDDVCAIASGRKEIMAKLSDDEVLDDLLGECGDADTLTLWHIFDSERAPEWVRARVLKRLERQFPLPPGVDGAGLVAGDRAMRRAWRETMLPAWRVSSVLDSKR